MSLLDGDCNDYGKRYDLSDEYIEALRKIMEESPMRSIFENLKPISYIIDHPFCYSDYLAWVTVPKFNMTFDINYN